MVQMAKNTDANPKPSDESDSECLQLLAEFVEMFRTIPQSYCLFCKANTALGIAAHKKSCPLRTVPSQRWMTFVRNHAKAIVASDFCISVTAWFRVVYVFLIME